MNEIIKQVVDKIKNMPTGTRFTVAELIAQYGVDVKDTKKMFEYHKLIYTQISNIVKTPDEYVGAKVGLPFNVPLEITKK